MEGRNEVVEGGGWRVRFFSLALKKKFFIFFLDSKRYDFNPPPFIFYYIRIIIIIIKYNIKIGKKWWWRV